MFVPSIYRSCCCRRKVQQWISRKLGLSLVVAMTDHKRSSTDDTLSPRRLLEQSSPRTRAVAISDLAASLQDDCKGWEAEREAWTSERAGLKAKASSSDRQVAGLKQELKRLGRVTADVRHENQRLALERAALRGENDLLVARNRTLEARSVEMRQDIKIIAKRNRELLILMKRELGRVNDGEGGSSVCGVCRKELTSRVSSSDVGKASLRAAAPSTAHPAAPAPCAARTEDPVPRRSNGRRRRGDDSGDENDVATPGNKRTHGGNRHLRARPVCGGGLRDDAVALDEGDGQEVTEAEAQQTDGARSLLKSEVGSASGGPSSEQQRGTATVEGGGDGGGNGGVADPRPVAAEAEKVRTPRAAAVDRDEIDRRVDARSGGNDSPGRAPPGTSSAPPANLAGSEQRLPTTSSSSYSSSKRTKLPAPSRGDKKRSRLSLGAIGDEQRSPEIVEVVTAWGESRRASERLGAQLWQGASAAAGRRSEEVVASATSAAGESRRRATATSGGTDRPRGDRGHEGKYEGDGNRQRRRKRTFRPLAGPDCEPPGLFLGRRPSENRHERGSSKDPPVRGVSNGDSDGDGSASFVAREEDEAGEWREGSGNTSSEMHEGAYPPLAMAAVYSPSKKKGHSSRRRQQQQEVNPCRQRQQEPARPLLKISTGQQQILGGVYATSAKTQAGARTVDTDQSSERTTKGGSVQAPGGGGKRPEARRSRPAVAPLGDRHGAHESHVPDEDKGSLVPPPRSNTEAAEADHGARTEDGSRWRGDTDRGTSSSRGHVPGPRLERKSAVEARLEGEGGEAAMQERGHRWRRRLRPGEAVEADDPSNVTGDGGDWGNDSRDGRSLNAGSGVGTAMTAAETAERRPVVANPYRGGEGDVGEEKEGGRRREGGGPYTIRFPRQQYKFHEVVRDRAKRAAMKGHECQECAAYVAAVGGSPGEREALLNMCSRHKHTEANGLPADTPDGFWDLSFADSVRDAREKKNETKEPLLQRRRQPQGQQQEPPDRGDAEENDDDSSSLGF